MVDDNKQENNYPYKYSVVREDQPHKRGLLNLIKSLWSPSQTSDLKLIGRISELHQDARTALEQLALLKETLKEELANQDPTLWNLVEAVINPLLREFAQIDRKLHHPPDVQIDPQHTIRSAEDLIEKAKRWTAICSRPHDREGIAKAVVAHAIYGFSIIIDRDLKMIFDYREHKLLALQLPPQQILQVMEELDETLSPLMHDLQELKKSRPSFHHLDLLSGWKREVDQLRDQYFNQALKEIDGFITVFGSIPIEEENQEHLTDILLHLAELEERVPDFQKRLNNLDPGDEENKKAMKETLQELEVQTHQLNGDLRLTPELVDRVQVLIDQLSAAHFLLDE